jgi:formyl-CoA transferase
VSLFDALAEWMLAPALYTAYGGTPPGRTGPHHASIAPYGPVTTQDGHEVFIAVQNAREWQRFCDDVIEAPGLAGDPRFATNALRVANREALHQAIGTRTRAALARAELLARLDGAGIAWAEMRTIHGLLEHPALAARQRWRAVQTPLGSIRTLRPPVSIENRDAPPGAVPAVGQHTDGILAELGFSPAAITRWRAEGTI